MILTCNECGKKFKDSHKNRKHCSKECYSESRKGIKPADKDGNPIGFTTETAKKYGFKKGNKHGFKKGYKPWNKGKHFVARDLKGKTWEELYGKEKAEEIREKCSNENNPNWKGDKAGHHSLHTWVKTRLGTPKECEHCGTEDARFFDWANKSGEYKREINDWIRLCRSCHIEYDCENGRGNKIKKRFGSSDGKYVL